MSKLRPLSNEMEWQRSNDGCDQQMMKSKDIESFKNRFRKSDKDNDDLLDQLSHDKRRLERKEREMETERIGLYRRIDELEAQRLEVIDKASRYSVEELVKSRLDETEQKLHDAEEREKNFKEQLDIVKRSLKDKDNVKRESEMQKERARQLQEMTDKLSLENAKLREDLVQNSRLLNQVLGENNGLRQRTTDSMELEKDFQVQKQLFLSVLKDETTKAKKAEAETEVIRETVRANEQAMRDELQRLTDQVQEKEYLLEKELKEKWKLESQNDNQSRTEMNLHTQVEDMLTGMRDMQRSSDDANGARNNCAELRAENDRLLSFLETKDKRHQEAMIGRDIEHALELKRLSEEWKTKMGDLEEKVCQRNLEVEMEKSMEPSNKEKLMETVSLKTKEAKDLNEELARCRSEMDKLRTAVGSLNTVEDKCGKLERALVRLKLENNEIRSPRNENGMKDLLREKDSHIVDLRCEVLALRETIKKHQTIQTNVGDPQTGAGDQCVTREKYEEILSAHKKLLDKTTRLRMAEESGSGSSPSLRQQLDDARRKLQASSARISQLEQWLDEIYSDPEIMGHRTSKAFKETGRGKVLSLPEVKSSVLASTVRLTANRFANPKGKLSTLKNGKRNS